MRRPNETGTRKIRLHGPILFLTEDPETVAAQLSGGTAPSPAELLRKPLRDNISTDEIIPGWCCYWYDEQLADFAYLGLRGHQVTRGAVRAFAPQIVVSGAAKGCGSSREHAALAEKYAGVELVFARSFERIYEQNCRNIGIATCSDFGLLEALLAGAELPLARFTAAANDIERAIIDLGGLFGFNRARSSPPMTRFAAARPLNAIEKVLQRTLSARNPLPPGRTIEVGESYFVEADIRFSHEYVTPMAAEMFAREFGAEARPSQPATCYYFQDHLSLAESVLSRRDDGRELIGRVNSLRTRQREFAEKSGGNFIGPALSGGSRAICHNYIVEHVAEPGDVIIGTDSHTCTAGALGAFAFGVGATDMANAWYNREILVKVPAVIKIELQRQLRPGVCAKDVMLTLLANARVREGRTLGKVLLFSGEGVAGLNIDERATLCNMAVEAGAMTAVVEPDDRTRDHLAARPGPPRSHRIDAVSSDDGAGYAEVVALPLDAIEPMVALPGDPRNAVPLSTIRDDVPVDKVYGGSCTGGKSHDMDMYASVFALARERGFSVPAGVRAFIQCGSTDVMRYATARGYVELFTAVGVTVLPPSCGACINAGPGISESPTEVTVSAQNRNFPGRSGPGQVYLASPYVVAATAIAGRLSSVAAMFGEESEA